MRIVFCGTGEIGLPTLRVLAESGSHDLIGVVSQPDRPAGRDLKPRASAIKIEAQSRGIDIFQPARMRDPSARDFLMGLAPDAMVVAAYGQILPAEILQLPRFGCLNVHVSLLPRHRGASPIQSAILAGDSETGVTVMAMDEGLDTGDILLVSKTEIRAEETAGELHDRLAAMAPAAVMQSLEQLAAGTSVRTPQENALATHAPKLQKSDGWLDWSRPAGELARRVRAMNPWPGAAARLSDQTLKVHRARAVAGEGEPGTILSAGKDGFLIATGSGALALEEVQLEGRKRTSGLEFLRGYRLAVGEKLFSVDEAGSSVRQAPAKPPAA